MKSYHSHSVVCPACQLDLPWSDQIAGHEVVCICGQALQLPDHPGQSPIPQPERSPRALVPCVRCHHWLEPDAVVCVTCGYDYRSGRVAGDPPETTARPGTLEAYWQTPRGRWQIFAQTRLPWILLAGGLIGSMILTLLGPSGLSIGWQIYLVLGGWLLSLGICLLMSYVVEHVLDFSFAGLGERSLKISSMTAMAILMQIVMVRLFEHLPSMALPGLGLYFGFFLRAIIYALLIQIFYGLLSEQKWAAWIAGVVFLLAEGCFVTVVTLG